MYRSIAFVAFVAVGATAVYAQNLDVIKQRREAMRTIGEASGRNFKMVKGEAPFELATVQAGLKVFQEQAAKFKGLFPDDAKTGGGTDAAPKIWLERAGFDAAIATWIANAKAAETTIKDEASFKAEYPKVASACGGCHKSADGYAISLGESFKKPKP